MSKIAGSLREILEKCGLKDGMCVSFHHHLRNGDLVLNLVMEEIAACGVKNIKVNASSIVDAHAPLVDHILNGVVTEIETDYMSSAVGSQISAGILEKPVIFQTHGGRAAAVDNGSSPIDIAFIAASASDCMGNCTGKIGKSAFGSIGYARADAEKAKHVVIITDELHPYPLTCRSITETTVEFVLMVDRIGDPRGIATGTTKMPSDPTALLIADLAAKAIDASGLLKDGVSFQTGAGGASLATAACLHKLMKKRNIHGSYAMGGITGYLVDMLRDGCFDALQDVQCFDLRAIESIRTDPRHLELSGCNYASPFVRSSAASNLDVVVLAATEVDLDFNVNVHTDSLGRIMGGSGGHSDVAEEAKLTVIVVPLFRTRLPCILSHVTTVSTPGSSVDLIVTQAGIAVNPKDPELKQRLKEARLPVFEIEELYQRAVDWCGGALVAPKVTDRVVGLVQSRRGEVIDRIYQVAQEEE